MDPQNKDHKSIGVGVAAGAATTTAAVIKHNIDLNKDLAEIKGHRVNGLNDLAAKMRPGDVLVQGYNRKTSYNPFGKIPIKNSDMIQSFYGTPYTHAAMYEGKGKVIHSSGQGETIKRRGFKDLMKGTDAVAIRYKVSDKGSAKALAHAQSQIGKPYTGGVDMAKAVGKELFGAGTKIKGKCNTHTCTTVINDSYKSKSKSLHEHPLEAVRRGDAEIVGYHHGFIKGNTTAHQLPSRVIAPASRALKIAIPVAAATALAHHLITKKKES